MGFLLSNDNTDHNYTPHLPPPSKFFKYKNKDFPKIRCYYGMVRVGIGLYRLEWVGIDLVWIGTDWYWHYNLADHPTPPHIIHPSFCNL